jgi:hypothetical protein
MGKGGRSTLGIARESIHEVICKPGEPWHTVPQLNRGKAVATDAYLVGCGCINPILHRLGLRSVFFADSKNGCYRLMHDRQIYRSSFRPLSDWLITTGFTSHRLHCKSSARDNRARRNIQKESSYLNSKTSGYALIL